MAFPHASRKKTAFGLCLSLSIVFLLAGLLYLRQWADLSPLELKSHTSTPSKTNGNQAEKPVSSLNFPPSQSPADELHTTGKLGNGEWKFDPTEDAENYGLDDAQCDAAFPALYFEIDRAAAWWRSNRNITLEDVDISWKGSGMVRAMIYGHQLYVIEPRYNGEGYDIRRALALLSSIHRAVVAYHGTIPNVEFSFSINDVPDPDHAAKPVWTLRRRVDAKEKWLMPDFGYWSWDLDLNGSYEQIRREIAAIETDFREKKPLAVWRGAKSNNVRTDLLNVAAGRTWSDVKEIAWPGMTWFRSESQGEFIRIADLCRYKFVIQTEGASYFSRDKYLQNCDSVIIMHRRQWVDNHHHLLITEGLDQNVVEVERDFSDLPLKMDYLLSHPIEAERIANNGAKTFRDRYLTPAVQTCYWRRLFRRWREVSFEPYLYDDLEEEDAVTSQFSTKKKLRGVPYETYVRTAFNDYMPKCTWARKISRMC
ncbi:MAG: hypothetical protein Q9165_000802 [Trypethelium subeluteriae]